MNVRVPDNSLIQIQINDLIEALIKKEGLWKCLGSRCI